MKERLAIFVDGCFWHGCPVHYVRPRSREEFWSAKLSENIDRDSRQSAALEAAGWRVLRLWEHDLVLDLAGAVEQVDRALKVNVLSWAAQRRVRRVVDLGGGFERREIVSLGAPAIAVGCNAGIRITAKARSSGKAPRVQVRRLTKGA